MVQMLIMLWGNRTDRNKTAAHDTEEDNDHYPNSYFWFLNVYQPIHSIDLWTQNCQQLHGFLPVVSTISNYKND